MLGAFAIELLGGSLECQDAGARRKALREQLAQPLEFVIYDGDLAALGVAHRAEAANLLVELIDLLILNIDLALHRDAPGIEHGLLARENLGDVAIAPAGGEFGRESQLLVVPLFGEQAILAGTQGVKARLDDAEPG